MSHLVCTLTAPPSPSHFQVKLPTDLSQSAASFYHQAAARVQDIFSNFYLGKNYKFANNSSTTKAREKNKHRFGILGNFLMHVWLNLKAIKFYLIKLATDFYWVKDPHRSTTVQHRWLRRLKTYLNQLVRVIMTYSVARANIIWKAE
jgi:hypothetical protein